MSKLISRIRPQFSRILVKQLEAPKQSASGLYLPKSAAAQDIKQGVVVSVGPGFTNSKGKFFETTIKPGQTVILPDFGGQEIKEDDTTYVLLEESQCVATIADE